MALIHHVVSGTGSPPMLFVHGFSCAHADWDAQLACFSPRHQTVAVDLRGHGRSMGQAGECSVERYGADVAEVMRALALPPTILVGHSMGCRVVIEAALQDPAQTAGVILVDGSQFSAAMQPLMKQRFAAVGGYSTMVESMFEDMFTAKSDKAIVASVVTRAARLPKAIGEKLLTDLVRYDVGRLETSLASLRVPVMVVQTTFSNEKRERRSLRKGDTSPYLDMLRAKVPSIQVEIIADTGHFPQLDESGHLNALIGNFVQSSQIEQPAH